MSQKTVNLNIHCCENPEADFYIPNEYSVAEPQYLWQADDFTVRGNKNLVN
jgi:hypothetical protein